MDEPRAASASSVVTLRTKNLNLLPVLLALLEEESVVRAAERVHLSQPATSAALARLRTEFDDPLLVRVGRTMQRTTRGKDLLPLVRRQCADLERLFTDDTFDPATAQDRFVIAAPDHIVYLLCRELIGRLYIEAPHVRIEFVEVSMDLERLLHEGTIDLAVCANFGFWTGLNYRPLFHERFVAAMSSTHPLARRRSVKPEDLDGYPRLRRGVILLRSGDPVSTGMEIFDRDLDQQISISQFTDAVLLTIGTMCVTPAPEMLVNDLRAILPIVGVPFSPDDAAEAGIFSAPFQQESPKLEWLRSLVEHAFASVPAPSGTKSLDGQPSKR